MFFKRCSNLSDFRALKFRNMFKESYFISKPKWVPEDMPDQTGRTILVTGGNSGIGKECVKVSCWLVWPLKSLSKVLVRRFYWRTLTFTWHVGIVKSQRNSFKSYLNWREGELNISSWTSVTLRQSSRQLRHLWGKDHSTCIPIRLYQLIIGSKEKELHALINNA